MKTVALPGYEERVQNYVAALRTLDIEPVVTLDTADAARCDGLLLPGGGDIHPARFGAENAGSFDIDLLLDQAQIAILEAFVQTQKAILDSFVQARRPVLGICRGHQLINVYFGGDLIQDLPTAESHKAHDHADSVHPTAVAPDSLLHRLYGGDVAVNSSHHQGLGRIGQGLRVTATAPDGVIEAVEHESLPILGVQFHPERMAFAHARPDTADGRPIFEWLKSQL